MTAQERQRALSPERTASFQRMLELEKKYKFQRLQRGSVASEVDILDSSLPQSPVSPRRFPLQPTLQARRRDSSPQQQEASTPDAMAKIMPQAADIPPLSITIPPLRLPVKADVARAGDKVKAEMQPKTVTFLTPDEDELSDQSSICQSPNWEGYGDKKKKKKKEEAELKRKEKGRAADEAKEATATKRKLASRLTKKPPQEGRPLPERTISPSLLANQYSPIDSKSFVVHRVRETGGDDSKRSSMSFNPSLPIAPLTGNESLAGGIRAEHDRQGAPHKSIGPSSSVTRIAAVEHLPSDRVNSTGRPTSASPETPTSLSTPTGRVTPSVSYPPTASKTYTLQRQANPPASRPRSRSGSLLGETASRLQEASKFFKSRNMKSNKVPKHYSGSNSSADSVNTLQSESEGRGRPSIGSYVRHQREQSDERSIKGHMNELKLSHPPALSHPAPGSQPATNGETAKKRHSLTSTGYPPLAARDESRFSVSNPAVAARNASSQRPTPPSRPDAPHRRSFREAAMAAFRRTSVSNPVNPVPPSPGPGNTAPGFSAEASATPMHTRSEPTTAADGLTFGYEVPPYHAMQNDSDTTVESQLDKSDSSDTRTASSASSYNEFGTTISPATTPDTSRPQSRGGAPMTRLTVRGSTPKLISPDDDEPMLRLSPTKRLSERPYSGYYSRPLSRGQPRADPDNGRSDGNEGTNKAHEDLPDVGDSWSRAELPLSLDSQSIITSLTAAETSGSTLDLMPLPLEIQSPKKDTKESDQRGPSGSQSFSDPVVGDRIESNSPGPQPIPPRSKARDYLDLLPTEILAAHPAKPKPSRNNGLPADNAVAAAASYLREARQAVTSSPRPLSSPAAAAPPSVHPSRGVGPLQPTPRTRQSLNLPSSSSPSLSSSSSSRQLHGAAASPIAKMFVECCSCKFYQDMPARVYECMARPDATVSDARLGVSGAITTCVRCPWCSHNMSTQCCAGYAAVVYLREKLHGV